MNYLRPLRLAVLTYVLLAGCVPILHPIYTNDAEVSALGVRYDTVGSEELTVQQEMWVVGPVVA